MQHAIVSLRVVRFGASLGFCKRFVRFLEASVALVLESVVPIDYAQAAWHHLW